MSEHVSLPTDITPSQVKTGMTVRLHVKIKDVADNGTEKERIQVFEGIVMNVGGKATSKTMTVRKVTEGVGVERIFPINSPVLTRIQLVKMAKVRRKNISFIRTTKKRLRDIKNVKLKA